MNRRTFVKSGLAILLGMIGLNSIKKQVPDEKASRAKPVDLLYRPHSHNSDAIKTSRQSPTNKYSLGSDEVDIREIIHGDIVEDDEATKVTTRFFYKGRRGITTTYISNNLLWDADFNLIEMLREVIFSDIRTGM